MGYPATQDGYICLNPNNGYIVISKDIFIEEDFKLNLLLAHDNDEAHEHQAEDLYTRILQISNHSAYQFSSKVKGE